MMKRRYNSVEKFTEMSLSQGSDTESQPLNPSRRKSHENLISLPTSMPSYPNEGVKSHLARPTSVHYYPSNLPIPNQQSRPQIPFTDSIGRNQPPRVPPYNSPTMANSQRQSNRSRPYPNNNLHRAAESVASTNRTLKSYEKLADVYSASSDSLQFVDNLRAFFDNNIPGFVWTVFSILQIVAGLVSIFVGTFNYSLCHIEPKIPLYLIFSGIILIVNGSIRICVQIPTPTGKINRSKGFGVRNMCRYALESSILFTILVIVILGCVWVYGAKYVQFERYRFERNYCDYFLYWFSWWSVTIHLLVFAIIIICLITILIYGAMVSK